MFVTNLEFYSLNEWRESIMELLIMGLIVFGFAWAMDVLVPGSDGDE